MKLLGVGGEPIFAHAEPVRSAAARITRCTIVAPSIYFGVILGLMRLTDFIVVRVGDIFGALARLTEKVVSCIKKMSYHTLELFAGGGGSLLGFEQAGFETGLAFENDKDSVETLRLNRPDVLVVDEDLNGYDFERFEGFYKPDVIVAGFPCQPFSVAGKKMGLKDKRGLLIFDVIRAIDVFKPPLVILENVKMLLGLPGVMDVIAQELYDIDYQLDYEVLNAVNYGVPQKRERVIMAAYPMRDDVFFRFKFPEPSDEVITLGEALADCPESPGWLYPDKKREVLDMVPEGANWSALPERVAIDYMGKDYYRQDNGSSIGIARRLSRYKPAPTLLTSPAQRYTELCHPTQTRPLQTREYARLQTFPDDWEFVGSNNSVYRQIGNALPVEMARRIAEAAKDFLNLT